MSLWIYFQFSTLMRINSAVYQLFSQLLCSQEIGNRMAKHSQTLGARKRSCAIISLKNLVTDWCMICGYLYWVCALKRAQFKPRLRNNRSDWQCFSVIRIYSVFKNSSGYLNTVCEDGMTRGKRPWSWLLHEGNTQKYLTFFIMPHFARFRLL